MLNGDKKDKLSVKERIHLLRRGGYNPIHLWGNIYLVRRKSTVVSDFPYYKIEILSE